MAAPELDHVTLRPLPALGRMAIALHGDLDVASGERLAARAIAAMIEGWDVDLDLSAVTFADGRGMHALGDIRSFADGCGREVALDARLPAAQPAAGSMMPSITSRNRGTSSGLVRYSAAPSSRIRRT